MVIVKFSLFKEWKPYDLFMSLEFFDKVTVFCKDKFDMVVLDNLMDNYRDGICPDHIEFEDEADAIIFILGFWG
jgi:hypothetical protein